MHNIFMMAIVGVLLATAADAMQVNVEAVVTKPYTPANTDPLSLMVTRDAVLNGEVKISKGTLFECPVDAKHSSGNTALKFRCSPASFETPDGGIASSMHGTFRVDISMATGSDSGSETIDLSPAITIPTGSTVNLLFEINGTDQ